MPISATGNSAAPRDAGFSLVEALTALMIVALVAGAVLLAAPGTESKTRAEAERLAARLVLAGDESVVLNRALRLIVTDEGYGFERLEQGGWVAMEHGSSLGFRAWPARTRVRIETSESEEAAARFDALGAVTPVSLVMSGDGAQWRVSVGRMGEVHVAPAE